MLDGIDPCIKLNQTAKAKTKEQMFSVEVLTTNAETGSWAQEYSGNTLKNRVHFPRSVTYIY